jgi:hypothetical protein
MVPLLVRLTYPQITQITQIKAKKIIPKAMLGEPAQSAFENMDAWKCEYSFKRAI